MKNKRDFSCLESVRFGDLGWWFHLFMTLILITMRAGLVDISGFSTVDWWFWPCKFRFSPTDAWGSTWWLRSIYVVRFARSLKSRACSWANVMQAKHAGVGRRTTRWPIDSLNSVISVSFHYPINDFLSSGIDFFPKPGVKDCAIGDQIDDFIPSESVGLRYMLGL